jgi:hypothetical protein
MSYVRFGLMIATSTVVMFILMYLNTYAWEHVFFSETRTYMAIMMGATMAVIMLAYMLGMYSNTMLNAIFAGAVIVFASRSGSCAPRSPSRGQLHARDDPAPFDRGHDLGARPDPRPARASPGRRDHRGPAARDRRDALPDRRGLGRQHRPDDLPRPARRGGLGRGRAANTLISTLDLSPMPEAEADRILATQDRCMFNRSPEADPVLWTNADGGQAAMKLNGVLMPLERSGDGTSPRTRRPSRSGRSGRRPTGARTRNWSSGSNGGSPSATGGSGPAPDDGLPRSSQKIPLASRSART